MRHGSWDCVREPETQSDPGLKGEEDKAKGEGPVSYLGYTPRSGGSA